MNTDVNFRDRLSSAISRSPLSKGEIASRVGVQPPALSRWIRGATPDMKHLTSLANVLNVDVQWLLTGQGLLDTLNNSMSTTISQLVGKSAPPKSNVSIDSIPMRWVPVISWAHAGQAQAYEELPTQWQNESVPTTCRDEKAFGLIIEGDSMEPRCMPGDRVVIMPSEPPRNGCLVVAKLKNDGVLLRRFMRLPDGRIRLIAYNEIYPAMDYESSEFHWIYPVSETVRKEWS
jgi:phage repressor protein C with HTH and peptisase S24 domain